MSDWTTICTVDDLLPLRGVAAWVDDRAVAVVRVGDVVHAVHNVDPFTGASVLSRGLVADRDGQVALVSPLHKQAFALDSGQCLDDPDVRLEVFEVRVEDGDVAVRPAPSGMLDGDVAATDGTREVMA